MSNQFELLIYISTCSGMMCVMKYNRLLTTYIVWNNYAVGYKITLGALILVDASYLRFGYIFLYCFMTSPRLSMIQRILDWMIEVSSGVQEAPFSLDIQNSKRDITTKTEISKHFNIFRCWLLTNDNSLWLKKNHFTCTLV